MIITLLLIPAVAWVVLLTWFSAALRRMLHHPVISPAAREAVTIVVAARNESHAITSLLHHIAAQHYDPTLIRIILSDDHSTDDTAGTALDAATRHGLSLKVVRPARRGKRAALDEALGLVETRWIAFTDADCRPAPGWIAGLMHEVTERGKLLALGAVRMEPGHTLFGRLQSAEYISLAALTAASAAAGRAVMANGASMAVSTEVYCRATARGYQKNFTSGDDMFLLQHVRQTYGKEAIGYAARSASEVAISPEPSLKRFVRQRLRWVSKAGGYTDTTIVTVAALTALTNLAVVISVVMALTGLASGYLPFWLYLMKTAAELPLLLLWSRHTRQLRTLLWWFLPLQLLYPFYALGFGAAGLLLKTSWR